MFNYCYKSISYTGKIYSWGHGGNGRLGLGNYDAQFKPCEVPLDISMICIAAGESHSASVDQFGNVFTWGDGSHGRSGHGEDIDSLFPHRVGSLSGIVCTQVALGRHQPR